MKVFNKLAIAVVSVAAISLGTAQNAQAASLINFEALGDGSQAVDDMEISDQFSSKFGVTFGIDNNFDGTADEGLFPRLERIGKDGTDGFVNGTVGKKDVASTEEEAKRLGQYFLRTAGLGGDGGALLISYDKATSGASGELWDIDGNGNGRRTEQWAIQALDNTGQILETILTPIGTNNKINQKGGELDGKAFLWEFDREEEDIHAIRFEFKGNSDPSKVGLAFDNFSARTNSSKFSKAQSVPEPASILGLIAVGSAATFAKRKRVSK